MKSFNVPIHYRSPLVNTIKQSRKVADKMKNDFTPTILQLGTLQLILARHFGFCYGVENAIEIAFNAVEENKGKRVFLLSEMIHNPGVNADLLALGVRFIMDTKGNMLLNWDDLNRDDIVIIPAFGTTVEIEEKLKSIGINPTIYETTCPFVEKVWNRAAKIGKEGYTIIIHGKPGHEETRATFSHSKENTPTLIVKDMAQAQLLGKYIAKELPAKQFYEDFKGQFSTGFDVEKDLVKIGVVNQTTMLATETQAISEYLKNTITNFYSNKDKNEELHFADMRDTLCYATHDNQTAVLNMLETVEANLALVIGGYNSSNTSHLVELCEAILPTYFISNETCLIDNKIIKHFDLHTHSEIITETYLPPTPNIKVMITSGASCPDSLVESIINRLAKLTANEEHLATMQKDWNA